MNVLGIETATVVCGAAISRDGTLVAERWISIPRVHSEKLMTLVDEVLVASGLTAPELSAIAVSIGPGSFTGLRIGLSVAKGLAYALSIPVVAVPTLEALAFHAAGHSTAEQGEMICAVLDARRAEVFVSLHAVTEHGRIDETVKSTAIPIARLIDIIPKGHTIHITGDAAESVYEYLSDISGLNVRLVPEVVRACSPSAVALRGEEYVHLGKVSDIATLEPMYIKEFYTTAQVVRQEKES